MKFILREVLLQFILLIYFITDVSPSEVIKLNEVIEYSNGNTLAVINPNNSSIPISVSVVTTPRSTNPIKRKRPLTKRLRRLPKKKKRLPGNQTTTIIPIIDFSTTINYPKKVLMDVTKNTKRRKLKTRRRKSRLRNRQRNTTVSTSTQSVREDNFLLEAKNLVLPIIPTQTPSFIRITTLNSPQKRRQETRCHKNNGGCTHICHVTGAKKCDCFRGFSLAKDRHTCIDNNECLINNGNCQMNCTNTIGSFQCHCPHGLRLSTDSRSCKDMNECLLRNGHGPCQDHCENTYGGYKCSCVRFRGTKLGNDLHSCIDVDECSKDNGGCSHICINTFGRSFCSCPEGMELSGDKTCQDINECENENVKNSCPNGCINTEGSYKCTSLFDLQNDESYNEVACKPLFPPQNGYFKCSRKHALKTFTKSGRKRIKNSLGTKCILVCPEGFRRRGNGFRISCGYGGQWIGSMDAKCIRA